VCIVHFQQAYSVLSILLTKLYSCWNYFELYICVVKVVSPQPPPAENEIVSKLYVSVCVCVCARARASCILSTTGY